MLQSKLEIGTRLLHYNALQLLTTEIRQNYGMNNLYRQINKRMVDEPCIRARITHIN